MWLDKNNPKHKHCQLTFLSDRRPGGTYGRSKRGSEGKITHSYLEQNFCLPAHSASRSYWVTLTHLELILLKVTEFPISYFVTWISFPHLWSLKLSAKYINHSKNINVLIYRINFNKYTRKLMWYLEGMFCAKLEHLQFT
jgi:hypothetical protein